MRRAAFLLSALLLASFTHGSGDGVLFHQKGGHEIDEGWKLAPFGYSEPDVLWVGADPTGSSSVTTHAATTYGSPTSGAGSYGTYLDADGSDDYVQFDASSTAEIGTGDFTACWLGEVSADSGLYPRFFDSRTSSGYACYGPNIGSTSATCFIQDNDTNNDSETFTVNFGTHLAFCLRVDYDGNFNVCTQSSCTAGSATPNSSGISNSMALKLGDNTSSARKLTGKHYQFAAWNELLSEADTQSILKHWLTIADAKGRSDASFSNTGPVCIACDGSVDCFADNVPPVCGGKYVANPSHTNALTYSEDFGTDWSATNLSVSTNTVAAPDGETTADTLHEDGTAASTHYVNNSFVAAASTKYTYAVWVKAANRSWLRMSIYSATDGSAFAYFNLSGDGTVGAESANDDAVIEAFNNGWYRCSLIDTRTTAEANTVYINVAEADSDVTFDGLNQDSLYVWGAQVTATSTAGHYCATEATAVTCGGDALEYDISDAEITVAANEAVTVADSDMSAGDTSAWTAVNNAALSKVDGALRVAYDGTNNPYAQPNVAPLTVGRTYNISVRARGDGSVQPRLGISGHVATGTTSTEWQTLTLTNKTATATWLTMTALATGAGYAEFDDLEITDITEELRGTVRCSGWFVPGTDEYTDLSYVYALSDGTNSNLSMLVIDTADRLGFFPEYGGGAHALSSAIAWDPTETYFIETRANYTTDDYQILLDGELVASDSTDLDSPVGLDQLSLGHDYEGSQQPEGSAQFFGWRCSR